MYIITLNIFMKKKQVCIIVSLIFCAILISGCVQNFDWLEDLKTEGKATSIQKCTYQEETVYYITSPCCDQYNFLYDKNGNKICAPDGGFTGQGDGQCSDFFTQKNSCEIIWEDSSLK